jgi:anti-sigma regulatory factor (Ser/Thr protein kinase)
MLIASELAGNAFLHGDGAIVLTVHRAEEQLRIEMLDEGHLMTSAS